MTLQRNPSTNNMVIGFRGDGRSGKANEAAPGQVALSERRTIGGDQINSRFYRDENGSTVQGALPTIGGNPLPGAPRVGADGSVVYDDAWAARNKGLIADYETRGVMPMGTPAPGVAQSMIGGGTPAFGELRPPQRFTAADRAAQADALDRQGRSNAEGRARDTANKAAASATRAAGYGEYEKAGALSDAARTAGGFSQGLQVPPRIGQTDPNAAARNAIEQQRVGIQAQQADVQNQNTQVNTQQQRMQLEQAQKAQALTDQLINGTPDQKKAAAQYFAALPGNKQGEPFTVDTEIPGATSMAPPIKIQRRFDATGKRIDQPTAYELNYEAAMRRAAAAKSPEEADAVWQMYRQNLGAIGE